MSAAKSITSVQAEIETSSERPKNLRVLVVEDDRSVAESYNQILSPIRKNLNLKSSRRVSTDRENKTSLFQFETTIVHDPDTAIAVVKKAIKENKPFAMGFFDVVLNSRIDGIELVKTLWELDPNLKSVLVTAYNDRSVDSIAEYLGLENSDRWDYLNKPFTESEIIQKARNATWQWNLQQKHTESQSHLAEAQKRLLESERYTSVAAISRSVSHEFGNILVQIMGRAELSLDLPHDEMKESMAMVLKAAETANQILKRFKNLSSGEESESETLIMQAYHPIEEALMLLDHQLKISNVKVCFIKKDKAQLRAVHTSLVQVFVNILINSLHAMDGSGQIDISVFDKNDEVEIHFRDYGPGIPKENLSKVTEAFFTTKKDRGGTGLGLSICKEIIEIEHGGKFEIGNHPVKGTEIKINLPKIFLEE